VTPGTVKFTSALRVAGLALATLTLSTAAQAATVVYNEGFVAGTYSPWTQGDAYWRNCSGQGNCVQASGGQSGAFLRLGTATGPEPDHTFFISPTISVVANAQYTLSFYLADDWAGSPAFNVPVLAKINGSALAAPVKASAGGWNLFSLIWNSGAATSAMIEFDNEYQLSGYYLNGFGSPGYLDWGYGNDFSIDTISLSCTANCTPVTTAAVPEPGSLALSALALLGLGLIRRKA